MLSAALPPGAYAADVCTVTFDSNGVDYSFPLKGYMIPKMTVPLHCSTRAGI